MKTFKLILTAFAIIFSTVLISSNSKNLKHIFGETPAKTIVIKNPGADDTNAFFSGSQVFFFEVFKIGDVKAVLDLIKKNKDVESCTANNVIGDFTPINLSLKSPKNKAFFIALFKSAGLNNIRINHKEVTSVDKM